MKGEPEWMLDFRLKAYAHYLERPMPEWGADLSVIDFDDVYYYIKPAAEARKHAQFAREMPQPRHSGHKNLIWMQNGISIERRAFYLGNVG